MTDQSAKNITFLQWENDMLQKKLLILSILCTSITHAQMTSHEIITKVNEIMNPASSWAKSKMVTITSSGKERTFVYESWSKNNGEKNLIKYTEPRRVKGQATLLLNFSDDIWMYFPRTQRVRKLASHAKKQKMEGSDFSYEDMGSGNSFLEDYDSKKLDDSKIDKQDCYVIEMLRKPDADISYSKLKMYILKSNFTPIKIEYFDDKSGQHSKTLTQYDIQNIDGIPTGMKMIMKNEIDNTQTSMEFIEIKYNLDLDDSMFTERGLKK